MPSTKKPTKVPKLSAAITEQLVSVLGTEDLEIREAAVATHSELGTLRLIRAQALGAPNSVELFTLDSVGTMRTRADLAAITGRDLFTPVFTPGTSLHPVRDREPVRIDPARNDWVLNKCDTAQETITVTIPKSGAAPKADVYLLADTTGSMGSVLDAVAAASNAIMSDPAFAGFDVGWGVGNYRDFPVDGVSNSYAFAHQLSPTDDTVAASAAVGTWVAGEGDDGSEGQLYALDRLATDPAIGWRSDAKRIVVWMGDAPGHDPICGSLTGLAAAITEATTTAALTGAQITVVAVGTDTGMAGDLDGDPNLSAYNYEAAGCTPAGSAGQASRITAATGGSYTSGLSPDQVVAGLVALIASAVTSVGNVHLEATGASAEFVDSIDPAGGYGPLPGDTEHTLTFTVRWRGTRACGREEQEFLGAIDVVADGAVVASKPVRVAVPACRQHYPVTFLCGDHGAERDKREERGDCVTVEPGHYATLVTIYNPNTCPVQIEKRFAPIELQGKTIAREPDTQPAERFAKLVLGPGEVTMDDCCALREAVGDAEPLIGVLDIVASGPLEVTVTLTTGAGGSHHGSSDSTPPPLRTAPGIASRTVEARMAP